MLRAGATRLGTSSGVAIVTSPSSSVSVLPINVPSSHPLIQEEGPSAWVLLVPDPPLTRWIVDRL